jgi:hypothetical protein
MHGILNYSLYQFSCDPLIVDKANKIACQQAVASPLGYSRQQRLILLGSRKVESNVIVLEGIGGVMLIPSQDFLCYRVQLDGIIR